jgi:hypothetical protein
MDARRCNLRARTTLAVIALALAAPTGIARAEDASELPPAPVDGVVEQPAGEVPEVSTDVPAATEPVAEPAQPVAEPSQPVADPSQPVADPSQPVADPSEPAGTKQRATDTSPPSDPLKREHQPAAPPRPADSQPPPADPPGAVPALAPGSASGPPAAVALRPLRPRHARSGGRGPRKHVGVLLRHVNQGIRNLQRELAAGRVPPERSLRDLRKNVEELVPAVDALERHRVPGPGVPGGQARFERGLRRAVAGAVVLVAALVRSGADTAESERLLGVLRRFAGISAGERSPERQGAAHAAPSAAAHLAAYTQAAARSHGSRGSSQSKAPPSVAIAGRLLRADLPPDPLSPASIARLAPSAPGGSSNIWLAAVALLLAVAASGSFTSMIMSRWDVRPAGSLRPPSPGGRRR